MPKPKKKREGGREERKKEAEEKREGRDGGKEEEKEGRKRKEGGREAGYHTHTHTAVSTRQEVLPRSSFHKELRGTEGQTILGFDYQPKLFLLTPLIIFI